MVRPCTTEEIGLIEEIINEAAEVYRGAIPDDCWHEPYMSRAELLAEIAAGVSFSGWEKAGALVGVMGLQPVRDVTLIRHAYVRPGHQGQGIGALLLNALRTQTPGRVLVGTWADAVWAIRFYERHGFKLVPAHDKDRLLQSYWTIPSRQRDVSVVLESTDQSGS